MKKLTVFLLLLVVMPMGVFASDRFFVVLYDVPVLVDLEQVPELSYEYDTLTGKIAHAAALTDESSESVYKAYSMTLPQFGWKNNGKHVYEREGEILSISHESLDKSWLFHFILRPKGENSPK